MLKYLDWHCIGAFALYCIFTRKACCKVLPSPAGREGGEILRVEWMQSGSSHPPSNDAGWHREAEDNILECVYRPWFHSYLSFCLSSSDVFSCFLTSQLSYSRVHTLVPRQNKMCLVQIPDTRHDELRYLAVWSYMYMHAVLLNMWENWDV